MAKRYPFVKQEVRDGATDLRATLLDIEKRMRTNDYTDWEELQLEVVAIAIQMTEKMKGK